MAVPKKKSATDDRTIYREFGNASNSAATERTVPERPPAQQTLRVQVERKGRGGKTVSVISGFQCSSETLATVLKQLKAQCGSGGTAKEGSIEIQGDHRQKVQQLLSQQGYVVKLSGG